MKKSFAYPYGVWLAVFILAPILMVVVYAFHNADGGFTLQGAIVLGMVYNFLPFMVLPIYTVLIKLDRKLIEAAQDLGAPTHLVFRRVIFPLSIPGVISGITMVFVPSVSTFVISQMLGSGKNLLVGDLIDLQFMGGAYNPHLGSAIALVMIILIFICMWIMNKFDDGSSEEGGLLL